MVYLYSAFLQSILQSALHSSIQTHWRKPCKVPTKAGILGIYKWDIILISYRLVFWISYTMTNMACMCCCLSHISYLKYENSFVVRGIEPQTYGFPGRRSLKPLSFGLGKVILTLIKMSKGPHIEQMN